MTSSRRGTLFLVAGPSGAGKDTLIAAARCRLAVTHAFPRRLITRPLADATEQHETMSEPAFLALRAQGQLALSWQAHGLWYGLPASINDDLTAGRHVVANVSRTVVAEASARFAPTRCILVTASAANLAARLVARGREAAPDIAARLEREIGFSPDHTVYNDGSLETAVERLIAALTC